MLDAIGICMQIFNKIDREKVFSIENLTQCFCARLYMVPLFKISSQKQFHFLIINHHCRFFCPSNSLLFWKKAFAVEGS